MKKRYTSHIFHFIMCILLTSLFWLPIWLPIWLLCGLCNSRHNKKVDDKYIQEAIKVGRVRL